MKISFIKQLFCLHDYIDHYDVSGFPDAMGWYECNKCGKIKYM